MDVWLVAWLPAREVVNNSGVKPLRRMMLVGEGAGNSVFSRDFCMELGNSHSQRFDQGLLNL